MGCAIAVNNRTIFARRNGIFVDIDVAVDAALAYAEIVENILYAHGSAGAQIADGVLIVTGGCSAEIVEDVLIVK